VLFGMAKPLTNHIKPCCKLFHSTFSDANEMVGWYHMRETWFPAGEIQLTLVTIR